MRLSSRPDVLRLKAKGDVTGLVRALGYRADAAIRKEASEALTSIGAPAIPALIQALAEPNLCESAKAILLNMGALSIDPLINTIKTSSHKQMRESAVKILADIGMFAIDPLVSTLSHKDPEVRSLAVDALAMIGPLAVDPLVQVLSNKNQSEYSRLDATKALTRLGGSQATNALLRAANKDPSTDVRKKAVEALGRPVRPAKPAAPAIQQTRVARPRGLSQRIKERQKKDEDQLLTGEIGNRWLRMSQELPDLKSISTDTFHTLTRTSAAHKRYTQPLAVLKSVDGMFSQYSRIKESTYTNISIRLVFDNEVSRAGRVLPATRQLELFIVLYKNQYHIFTNATYIDNY